MKLQITFRGGGQIEAEVKEFTEDRGGISGHLHGLHWVTPAGATRALKYVDVDQIAAIVAIYDPGDSDDRTEVSQ